MAIISYVAVLLLGVQIARAFKIGAPVVDYPGICLSLFPDGHNASAKTTPAPFRIDVSTTCATGTIFVTISATSNTTWFEGFLIQARPAKGGAIAFGEFGTNNDPQLQGLKCHNSPTPNINNSMGQSQAKRYYKKIFTWTPPTSEMEGGYQFVATIIHETPDFWLNVKSPVVSTTCAAAALTPTVAGFVLAVASVLLYSSRRDD